MLFLGLDIGTTGAKALVIDENGAIHGKGYTGYRLISDGCRIEQNADDWIQCGAQAMKQALNGNDEAHITAVSLSTQGASTVAVDADNKPIGNAFTWMDTRATEETTILRKELGDQYFYRTTGWRLSPSLDAAKIMHMKRCGKYVAAKWFFSTLEYVNLFLTGNPVCDPTNASIRQIFNVNACDYDETILNAVGVLQDELPPVKPTGSLVGTITADASAATGLKQGTPVFNGAHDQYCASIGAGAIGVGDMLLSAGTTWVLMGIDDKPLFTDTYIAPGVHPVTGLYGAIASLVGSGASLQWFKNEFINEDFDEINRETAGRMESTRDLFFYPYLTGANYPIWNLKARGAFTGIELGHDRFDFSRAIMEGVAFGVRSALDDFMRNGFQIKTLKIMGGAAKSAMWCSLVGAAANVDVEVCDNTDACAIGAAIVAAKGVGRYKDYHEAVSAISGKMKKISPDADLIKQMASKRNRYHAMWRGLVNYYNI